MKTLPWQVGGDKGISQEGDAIGESAKSTGQVGREWLELVGFVPQREGSLYKSGREPGGGWGRTGAVGT